MFQLIFYNYMSETLVNKFEELGWVMPQELDFWF